MATYRRCGKCGKKIPQGTKCECLKESIKEYNNRIRYNKDNIKYSKFYSSTSWRKLSKYIRIKYNDLCLRCYIKDKVIVPADVVHHITEIREDYSKRLEENNLITLCHSCHNNLHANYDAAAKKELYRIKNIYEDGNI